MTRRTTGAGAAVAGRRTTTRGAGCGAGAAVAAGRVVRTVGCGSGAASAVCVALAGGVTVISSGVPCVVWVGVARAAAAALADRLGVWPQINWRCRLTRGTQVTLPSMPARMNTQPRLSTYWVPLNEAGGNSAGACAFRKDCASPMPTERDATHAATAAILVKLIISPTRYGRHDASTPTLSKAAIPAIWCQTSDPRHPRGPERCSRYRSACRPPQL